MFKVGDLVKTLISDIYGQGLNHECIPAGEAGLIIEVEDTTAPVIDACPDDIMVNADAGGCDAVVNYTDPGATDNCDGAPVVTCVPASGFAFPTGTTEVICTAVDDCANSDAGSVCTFDVIVAGVNDVDIDIQLVGVILASTRCMHFVTDCGVTADVELPFDSSGFFTGIVEVPCGSWTQVCVKDEQHTLYQRLQNERDRADRP